MAKCASQKQSLSRTLFRSAVTLAASVVLVTGATNAMVVASTSGHIYEADQLDQLVQVGSGDFEKPYDCIVVLGAAVRSDGTPSEMLQHRLDVAIAAYRAGVAPKILMSGDNGTAHYNESDNMKAYAVAKGVPSEDVFCDYAGFDTYDSMYRAQSIFGAKRVFAATQEYHLFRALYIARGLGMEAAGVSGSLNRYAGQPWYSMREAAARTKDLLKVLLRPPATLGGDTISLHQSGDIK